MGVVDFFSLLDQRVDPSISRDSADAMARGGAETERNGRPPTTYGGIVDAGAEASRVETHGVRLPVQRSNGDMWEGRVAAYFGYDS